MKVFYAAVVALSFFDTIQAILDGRTTPTTIDYHYTFTSFEWARGHVTFKDGFDIPAAGTVLLDIYEPVQGLINFNGGTAFLQGDLEMGSLGNIVGPGFIETPFDIQKELVLSNNLALTSATSFFIKNDLQIRGKAGAAIFLQTASGGFLDLKSARRITFVDIEINQLSNERFPTLTTLPFLLTFKNCQLISNAGVFTINTERVNFRGETFISGRQGSTFSFPGRVTLHNFSSLCVDLGMIVQWSEFNIDNGAFVFLDNAIFDYTSTVTDDISISGVALGVGRFLFSGESVFKSSTGNKLYSRPGAEFGFLPGGRFVIDTGTHFEIQ